SKGDALNLAANEGFATYFALTAERANATPASQGVPTVGDFVYDNTAGLQQDMINEAGGGEDDELSVCGALLRLTNGTDGFTIDGRTLYRELVSAGPKTIGDAWDALAASRSGADRVKIAKTLAFEHIAPVQSTPADNFSLKPGDPIPTFTWK